MAKRYEAFIGGLLAILLAWPVFYYTKSLFIFPATFGITIPLLLIDAPFLKKLAQILFILLVSLSVFVIAVILIVSIRGNDKVVVRILPFLCSGVAAVTVTVSNGFFIKQIRLKSWTLLMTFLLAGLSTAFWIYMAEEVFPHLDSKYRGGGLFVLWIIATSLSIGIAIPNKPTANRGR